MTGKIIPPKALKFATALWPERSTLDRHVRYDNDHHGAKDGRESNYSNAVAGLCRKKRFRRSFGANCGRSSWRPDFAIWRAAQTSFHRRWKIAQLRECLFERRRHSLYGQG